MYEKYCRNAYQMTGKRSDAARVPPSTGRLDRAHQQASVPGPTKSSTTSWAHRNAGIILFTYLECGHSCAS
eukprot:6197999-Pleurochrysis_carterae.AAC.2